MDRGKYRGRRVDNGEWVSGHYVQLGAVSCILLTKKFHGNQDSYDENLREFGGWIDVIPDTVGQYTGRKDKNGVEIYFGCQAKHVDGMGSRIGTIVFDERMCCMGIKFEETTVFGGAILFEQCEVIHDKEQQ